MSYFNEIRFSKSETLDSFGRVRVSNPITLFDAQFTYGLQPLLYEELKTSLGGEAIAHSSANRCANLSFTSTPSGGECYLQTYEYFRYQPGKSQEIFITFNMREAVANCLKFAGYSDPYNGIQFQLNGTTKQFVVYSATDGSSQTATQANWNIDKFDGTGPSGLTLDIAKTQILYISFQALYVGTVQVGFDIGGKVYLAHEFHHANIATAPYIQYANLPVRCGMVCTATTTTTMQFVCCSVISEGGQDDTVGYSFATPFTLTTAASGARTHAISIEPAPTFNSLTNRTKVVLEAVDLLVVGNNPVFWELCLGQALDPGASKSNVNTTYSAMRYSSGALSGSPLIVMDAGFVAASNQTKTALQSGKLSIRYPITLTAGGSIRDLGRVTLLVRGIGGASDCYGQIKWKEIR
jgi:hypothetical protein